MQFNNKTKNWFSGFSSHELSKTVNYKFHSLILIFFFSQTLGIDPEGGALGYSISGPVFSVDRDTGVIRLRQGLDREVQDILEVIISITGKVKLELSII